MLTPTEAAASQMTSLTKCAKCQRKTQNWRLQYVCGKGLSPKTCGKNYRPDKIIARISAEEIFK